MVDKIKANLEKEMANFKGGEKAYFYNRMFSLLMSDELLNEEAEQENKEQLQGMLDEGENLIAFLYEEFERFETPNEDWAARVKFIFGW